MTYLVDGEQYISLLVEWGGGQGQYHKKVDQLYPGTVYTFKLGGTATLPSREAAPQRSLITGSTTAAPEDIGRGMNVYLRNCVTCHGEPGSGGGVIPDLLRSAPEVYEALDFIVLGGALAGLGMPGHSRQLSSSDVADLRDYLLFVAASLRSGITPQRLNQDLGAMQRQALDRQK
ncbi:MAG: c-type cytochrome [Proteobacteria bacterium]|nr:c-type cytochrome [Pseudomonadota bacterium]